MKLILSFLLFLVLLCLGAGGLWHWPKGAYREVVHEAKYSELYSLKVSAGGLLSPVSSGGKDLQKNPPSDFLWKKFFVQNYIIPLPIRHAEFYFVPIVNARDPNAPPQLGFTFFGQSKQKVLEIIFHPPQKFERGLSAQKLYQVPFFFEYLKEKKTWEIWQDIFSYDLSTPNADLQEMAYQLYVLEKRVNYFPSDLKRFFYLEDSERGIIELQNPGANTEKHLVFHLDQGMIHYFSLEVFDADPAYLEMRNLLAKEVHYQEFSEDLSRTIYHEFKALPYHRQISPEGMIYLFSAWSQNLDNRNFLKEMIHYLERGKDNLPQLGPLYDFALSRYHSSFSSKDSRLQEDAEERVRRKSEEERAQQRLNEAQRPIDLDDDKFPSDEEKIHFFLQKAKDQGVDTDKDVLTVD